MQLFPVLTIFYNKTSNNYESRRTALGYVTFFFLCVGPQQKHMVTARIHHNALFFPEGRRKLGSLYSLLVPASQVCHNLEA